MARRLPCPTPSFPKQLPAGLGIVKNSAFSCFLPFFFFFVFFPTSFLSLFLFWLFPPLTRFVRSWVGSLLISIHSSFWISDSDPTFASPKILILLPKMTHIYSSGALQQCHSTMLRYKDQMTNFSKLKDRFKLKFPLRIALC